MNPVMKAVSPSRLKRGPVSVFDLAKEPQTSLDSWTKEKKA